MMTAPSGCAWLGRSHGNRREVAAVGAGFRKSHRKDPLQGSRNPELLHSPHEGTLCQHAASRVVGHADRKLAAMRRLPTIRRRIGRPSCARDLRTGHFHVKEPSSGSTAGPRPDNLALRLEIGATASRPDLGITLHEVRSAVLQWETGPNRSSCRRRGRHQSGPMPRQTSCGCSSTPQTMALGRVPSDRSSARVAELTHTLAMR